MAQTDPVVYPSGQVRCSYHPNVMTGLRCNRCGKPICLQCAVRTPVGMRCPDCAGVRGLPTYRTPATDLVRATGAGLVVAILVAVVWRFLPEWQFYLCLLLGFGSVEAMAKVANNKRGVDLQVAALVVVTVGLVFSRVLLAQRFGVSLGDVNALEEGMISEEIIREFGGFASVGDVLQIRLVPDLLFAIMAYAIAWVRFR